MRALARRSIWRIGLLLQIGLLGALALLAVAGVLAWVRVSSEGSLAEHERRERLDLAVNLALHLSNEAGHTRDMLEAGAPALTSLLEKGDTTGLRRQLQAQLPLLGHWADGLAVVGQDGSVVAAEPASFALPPLAGRPFFQRLLATGEPQSSGALEGAGGESYLAQAVSLNAPAGGVVALAKVQGLVGEEVSDQEQGRVFLLDVEGAAAARLWPEARYELDGKERGLRGLLSGATAGTAYCRNCSRQSEEEQLMAFARLDETPSWVLVTMTPVSEVTAPARRLQRQLALAGGTLAVVALGLSLAGAWLWVFRMGLLSRLSRRMAEGVLDQPVPDMGRDEVGALARDLDVMRRSLKEERESLERRVADRTRELSALLAIDRAVSLDRPTEEVLSTALDELLHVVAADGGGIYILLDSGELEIRTHRGLPDEFVESVRRIRLGEGISGRAAELRQPVAMNISEYPTERLAPAIAREGFVALAGAPMMLGERLVGSVIVGRRRGETFTEHELSLLGSVASQVASSYDRRRLVSELESELAERKRAEEALAVEAERRAVLNRIAAAVSRTLDPQEVCNVLAGELPSVVPFDRATLLLLSEDGGHLKTLSIAGMEIPNYGSTSTFPIRGTASESVLRERRPMVESDMLSDASSQLYYTSRAFASAGLRSRVTAPMFVGERALGTLSVAHRQPSRYTEQDSVLLQAVAYQVGMALENTRLFQQTDAALQRRVEELQAISGVLAAGTQAGELDKVLAEALRVATDVLRLERGGVMLLDAGGKEAVVRATYSRGEAPPHPGQGAHLELDSLPLLRQVVKKRQPLVIEDIAALPDQPQRELAVRYGVHSALVVPLVASGRVIGTLQFTTTSGPRAYSRDEVALVEAMAGHLGAIVQSALLFDEVSQERQTLSAVLEGMTDGLVVTDAQGRVVYCNAAAGRILGMRPEEVHGQSLEAMAQLKASDFEDPSVPLRLLHGLGQERPEYMTVEAVLLLPQRRELVITTFPIASRQGAGTGHCILGRDITAEREALRRRDAFISIASHELRTPLTSLYGFSELLLTREVSRARRMEWLERIHKESKRLAGIVDDMLNVSRIQSGRITLREEPVPLLPVAEEVLRSVGSTTEHHRFAIDVPERLPAPIADRDKLSQVLWNLVDNAIKYSPEGGEVVVRAMEEPEQHRLVVSVSDQGMGIAPEDQARLFTTFHRIRRPETAGVRGTGLGLYIVKGLVELMGGEVWVSSELGEGTTFSFTLPTDSNDAMEVRGDD
ncbi:MAG: GAF domain-containing protein [Chloroflexi bacterium]|nr:GAF domain-containing protein [Chloroflexota bacterium]